LNLREILAALTWNDGLDFFLLYLVAYFSLRLLKGTRALPVLLSVLFFAIAALVAQQLDLVAIASLLKYFLEYVIIILIVVFNQELRRFLLRMGQRLLPMERREAESSAVKKLVTACERLARARVGALFILEGRIDVAQVSGDTGAEIDAAVTSETLVALQVPHGLNTTHDGAVLIRQFRIERAGLILPLSDQTLDPRFGTRHRGAIGVSEETDALVIVLSEERGEIRVAEAGRISEVLDAANLEARIEVWMASPPTAATSTSDMNVTEISVSDRPGISVTKETVSSDERARTITSERDEGLRSTTTRPGTVLEGESSG